MMMVMDHGGGEGMPGMESYCLEESPTPCYGVPKARWTCSQLSLSGMHEGEGKIRKAMQVLADWQ